jgi:hypothetical protein
VGVDAIVVVTKPHVMQQQVGATCARLQRCSHTYPENCDAVRFRTRHWLVLGRYVANWQSVVPWQAVQQVATLPTVTSVTEAESPSARYQFCPKFAHVERQSVGKDADVLDDAVEVKFWLVPEILAVRIVGLQAVQLVLRGLRPSPYVALAPTPPQTVAQLLLPYPGLQRSQSLASLDSTSPVVLPVGHCKHAAWRVKSSARSL